MSKISEALKKLYEREKLVSSEWFKETRAILLKNFPCPGELAPHDDVPVKGGA